MALLLLIKRNVKLYFKDRGIFLTSLITPMVLFVLFITFLGNIYESSLVHSIPPQLGISTDLIKSFTVSWLISSILGVSAVTIAFCSNIIMVQDKISGAADDLLVSPVKKSTLAISYYVANFISTFIICIIVLVVGFIYLSTFGWYYSVSDILYIILDVFLCVLFGTSLAALVDNFIKTEGGVGAVSTLMSALYGFICGAYMPISEFSESIRNFVSVLPGTYACSLLRSHFMNGVITEFGKVMNKDGIASIRDAFDANVYCFGTLVTDYQKYLIVTAAFVVFFLAYVLVNVINAKKAKRN